VWRARRYFGVEVERGWVWKWVREECVRVMRDLSSFASMWFNMSSTTPLLIAPRAWKSPMFMASLAKMRARENRANMRA
jgi:hypothetical protein